jgi:hypothetical protein
MSEMSQKLKNILNKYDILKDVKITNKAIPAFVDSMLLDLKYEEHNVRKIPFMNSSYFIKLFIVFLGVLNSNILYFFKIRNKIKFDFSSVKYIFLPFSDIDFIRFQNIPNIITKDYAIIYPPAFHINGVVKHLSFFCNKGIRVLTPSFGIKNAILLIYYSTKSISKIKRISNEIEREISVKAKNSFQLGFILSILYRNYMEFFLDDLSKVNKHKIIWFFDFDKDYKYIAFNSEIKNTRNDDLTVHLQHGLFWGNDLCYVSPNADYLFCCNNRERDIVLESISEPHRVLVTGAPLQSFEKTITKNSITVPNKYNYVVLLSSCFDEKVFQIQSQVLNYLRNKADVNYSVRLRPMSKESDITKLGDILDKNCITFGNSISQDIDNATTVISFSEDSLLECFRKNKPTFYGNPFDLKFIERNKISKMPFNVFSDISDFINLISSKKKSTQFDFKKDDFIKDNFGELDFEKMKQNFLLNIDKIL